MCCNFYCILIFLKKITESFTLICFSPVYQVTTQFALFLLGLLIQWTIFSISIILVIKCKGFKKYKNQCQRLEGSQNGNKVLTKKDKEWFALSRCLNSFILPKNIHLQLIKIEPFNSYRFVETNQMKWNLRTYPLICTGFSPSYTYQFQGTHPLAEDSWLKIKLVL